MTIRRATIIALILAASAFAQPKPLHIDGINTVALTCKTDVYNETAHWKLVLALYAEMIVSLPPDVAFQVAAQTADSILATEYNDCLVNATLSSNRIYHY